MVTQPWYPPGTDMSPPPPTLWRMHTSFRASVAYSASNKRTRTAPFINLGEVDECFRLLMLAQQGATPWFPGVQVPADFIRPRLRLAPELWSDLLKMSGHAFFSRPLREAMALPEQAAQFHPIELETTSEELRGKDYRWLSWLNMERDVVDPERSDCEWEDVHRPGVNEVFRRLKVARALVVRADFRPRFDLFRPFEKNSITCATPALEERVRHSGCVGVGLASFGARFGVPYWLSDEDGLRIDRPGELRDDLGPPASVREKRAGSLR